MATRSFRVIPSVPSRISLMKNHLSSRVQSVIKDFS
jgi:hypothetical protein